MIINHLIVGASDVRVSTEFYCDLLGFKKTGDDPGSDGGQVLEHDECKLLIVLFPKERLPNPAHFAFEVSNVDEFNRLIEKANAMNLSPRSMPSSNSKRGPTEFSRGSHRYRIFYIFDPSGVNLEIMVKI